MSSSSGSNIFILSIVGFFFGLYHFLMGFSYLKQKRLIENTPMSKIRSLAMGLVEIYGEVVPAEGTLLKSPFSIKDCVYCKYTIEEFSRSGKHSQWMDVKHGETMAPFYLKDDTGIVLVEPEDAKIDIPMDFEFNSSWGKDPPESIKQFLSKNGMSFEGFLGANKTMRYREYIIEPQNKLYVMGTAGINPFAEVENQRENAAGIRIQKGTNDKTYHISDQPEKEICNYLQINARVGIYGGGALSIVCFAIILYSLNII